MNDGAHFKDPSDCTEAELREFARLVRQGFPSADERLEGRIQNAKCLAFHYAAGDTLAAVAALKSPDEAYRSDVFDMANAGVDAADYEVELGWIFVVPTLRGNRIAESLCRELLTRVHSSCVFATTRTNNLTMTSILLALGFARAGKPYPWRHEELVLFLRPRPTESHPSNGARS